MQRNKVTMWVVITVLVVVLIGVGGVLVYQLGRRSQVEDIGRSLFGNEATQTAETQAQATFQARANDIYGTSTAIAVDNIATQTAVARP